MAVKREYITQQFPKTLLLGIQAPYNRNIDINSYFEEFLNLVKIQAHTTMRLSS